MGGGLSEKFLRTYDVSASHARSVITRFIDTSILMITGFYVGFLYQLVVLGVYVRIFRVKVFVLSSIFFPGGDVHTEKC